MNKFIAAITLTTMATAISLTPALADSAYPDRPIGVAVSYGANPLI
jgi:hypothetical protein